jgi:hypothetical protein
MSTSSDTDIGTPHPRRPGHGPVHGQPQWRRRCVAALPVVQPCQELLELLTELVGRRELVVSGQHGLPGAAREGVVLLLERAQHLLALLLADLAVHLTQRDRRGPGEGVQVEGQAGCRAGSLQQRHRCGRELDLRHVVRHVGDVSHRVVLPLPQAQLQERLRAGRHHQPSRPQVGSVHQLGPRGVRRDHDGPGVWHSHRHGADPHHQAYAEDLDDLADGSGESLPPVVGLGTCQQQVRGAGGVDEAADVQPRRLVGAVVVLVEGQRGSSCPVVEQPVDVQLGENVAAHLAGLVVRVVDTEQVLGRQPTRLPRRQEAVEGVQQHRPTVRRPQAAGTRCRQPQQIAPGGTGVVVAA